MPGRIGQSCRLSWGWGHLLGVVPDRRASVNLLDMGSGSPANVRETVQGEESGRGACPKDRGTEAVSSSEDWSNA